MKAALRVLTALSQHQKPDQADLDELHWYAPSDRPRPIDELVCEAIQRALHDREQKRKAAKAEERERALAIAAAVQDDSARELEQLARDHTRRREEYRLLTAKLNRLGIAPGNITDSNLGEITQLLQQHVSLSRRLKADEESLKEQ